MHTKTDGKRANKAITQAKTLQLATATRDRAPPPVEVSDRSDFRYMPDPALTLYYKESAFLHQCSTNLIIFDAITLERG